jgi:death-on-curing protein
MPRKPRWIAKRALLLLHEQSLAEFGGASGMRDEGLLDSALARPLNRHAYEPKSSLADLAASYGHGLAKNHAFVDGNKRIAFLAIGLFLDINGNMLTAEPVDAIAVMMAVASGELGADELARWIRAHSKQVPKP